MTSLRSFAALLRSRRGITSVAILMLAIFAGLCLDVARRASPTFDEPEQIGVGYASLTQGIHTYSTFNLRLSQIWEALPLLAFNPPPRFPTTEERQAAKEQNIYFGRLLLFAGGRDPQQLILASRSMVVALSVALGWLIFACSRKLHGDLAGLLSLSLYVCSPLVIAHGSLATTEIATALLLTGSTLILWRLIQRPTVGGAIAAGLMTGALLATKISGVLIVPIVGLLLVIRFLCRRTPGDFAATGAPGRVSSGVAISGALLGAGLLAWAVVWAVYGGPAAAPSGNPIPWESQAGEAARLAPRLIAQAREWRLLPDSYLSDLHNFTHTGDIRRAYLLGEYSVHGWWYFFPLAWLVKNPLPFLLALPAAALAAWRLRKRNRDEGAPDWNGLVPFAALALVYGGFAVSGNLNIGARHLLPLYPAALVFGGLAARLSFGAPWLRAAFIVALIGGSAIEVGLAHPHHIGYFNALAGGSRHGYRVMVDSSSDWGESLPDIRRWLDARRAKRSPEASPPPVYLSLFANADLSYYGLGGGAVVQLPQYYDNRPIGFYTLGPGTYLISATMLSAVYNGPFMGPWRATYEKLYQDRLRDMNELQPLLNSQATLNARLARDGLDVWMKRLSDFDYLRFGRLCAYLRQREPDDWVTPGMLVYDVTLDDLAHALSGPPPELRPDGVIKGAERHAPEELDFVK